MSDGGNPMMDSHIAETRLDSVVINYETEYKQYNKFENEIKSISRTSKTTKQSVIEETIRRRIKNTHEQITNILNNYAFDTANNVQINDIKNEIIAYFNDNKIDTKKLGQMTRSEFVQKLCAYCSSKSNINKITQIKQSFHDLYMIIAQYPEYLALSQKLKDNQHSLCCGRNYNEVIYIQECTVTITERSIHSNKIILKWMPFAHSINQNQSDTTRQRLNTSTQISLHNAKQEQEEYTQMNNKLSAKKQHFETMQISTINQFITLSKK
eukprot:409491_1